MSQEELSEYEAFKIEEHRKHMQELKEEVHERALKRKRICAIEEKIPACKLDILLKDFKQALTEKVDHLKLKRTTGLKESEKDELKRLISNKPSKNLNNPYKREVFSKKIIRSIFLATMIREHWEYGDSDGWRDPKILDSKFSTLIGVSWNDYIVWVNTIRQEEGRTPIPIKEIKRK